MNNKIKQFVAFCVCSVVALAVCLGVLIVTVNNIGDDTQVKENTVITNKTEVDSSRDVLVEYINDLVKGTEGRFVKTKTYTDVSVTDLIVDSGTNEADNSLFNFVKDRVVPTIDSYYSDDFVGSFEKTDSKKLLFALDKCFIEAVDYSIGQVDENGENLLDDEGNIVDNEFYYLNYALDINNEDFIKYIAETLSVENDISAKDKFVDAVKDDFKINVFKSTPESILIKVKVNRSTDEIQYINVIRSYKVEIDATFINKAEAFGEKDFSFNYCVTDTYEYSYAGISFLEDEITIEHDEEYMLNVNAMIDDDSEYSVEFSSSDENIAIVNEMGYVKGLKNCDVPAIVTVKLNYLGETFTDTCIVKVAVKEAF